jgi:hypothetical protein
VAAGLYSKNKFELASVVKVLREFVHTLDCRAAQHMNIGSGEYDSFLALQVAICADASFQNYGS